MSELFLNIITIFISIILFVFGILSPLWLFEFRLFASKKEYCDKGGVHKWIGNKKTAIECDSWLCYEGELIYKEHICKKCNKIKKIKI